MAATEESWVNEMVSINKDVVERKTDAGIPSVSVSLVGLGRGRILGRIDAEALN